MKNFSRIQQDTHKGFTLLEMLFAIIIFSFSLVSLMLIAGKGVIATTTAKDQLVAQYLAEEGAEVARNMRDTNFLTMNTEGWLAGLDSCTEDSPCDVVYPESGAPYILPIGERAKESHLYENNGYYSNDSSIGGNPSKFSRKIYLEEITGHESIIYSIVSWQERNSITRNFEFKTYISNWQNSSESSGG